MKGTKDPGALMVAMEKESNRGTSQQYWMGGDYYTEWYILKNGVLIKTLNTIASNNTQVDSSH